MEKYWGVEGAFSSKLIQLRLNSIYNSKFRYNWGEGGGGGVQKPFEGDTSGGVPKITRGAKNYEGCAPPPPPRKSVHAIVRARPFTCGLTTLSS